MALVKSGFSGGDFFRPKDHLTAKAILIEPCSVRKSVNKFGAEQNYVTADISIFPDTPSLETGTPIVQLNATIGGGVLANDMAERIGDACIVQLAERENKKGTHPLVVGLDVDLAVAEAVEVYYNKREAKAEADLPDFLS